MKRTINSLNSFTLQKDQIDKSIGTTFGYEQFYFHAGGYSREKSAIRYFCLIDFSASNVSNKI